MPEKQNPAPLAGGNRAGVECASKQTENSNIVSGAQQDDSFDWRDDPAIVCRGHGPVAAYLNAAGQIVIRQESWPDDDPYIVINVECGHHLVGALQTLIAEAAGG